MIETDADRDIFCDPDAFGEEIIVNPGAESERTFVGIFDARPVEKLINPANRYGENSTSGKFSGSGPQVEAKTVDVVDLKPQTDTIGARGVTYTIQDNKPDSTGMSVLRLMKA